MVMTSVWPRFLANPVDLLFLDLMYVKKIHQFLSSTKKMHTKENWFLFLPHCVLLCSLTIDIE